MENEQKRNENLAPVQKSAGEIAVSQKGIAIRNVEELFRFSGMILSSGFAPKAFKTKEQIATAIQMGLELGLSPLTALRGIAVVNGRPTVWGSVALGLCRASGLFDDDQFHEEIEYDKQGIATKATCTVARKGRKPITRTFTLAEAKQAKLLTKDVWRNYTGRMLQWRSRGLALNDCFADVLNGIEIVDEQTGESTSSFVEIDPDEVEKSL